MIYNDVRDAKEAGIIDSHLCRDSYGTLLFIEGLMISCELGEDMYIFSLWAKDSNGESEEYKPDQLSFQTLKGWT